MMALTGNYYLLIMILIGNRNQGVARPSYRELLALVVGEVAGIDLIPGGDSPISRIMCVYMWVLYVYKLDLMFKLLFFPLLYKDI